MVVIEVIFWLSVFVFVCRSSSSRFGSEVVFVLWTVMVYCTCNKKFNDNNERIILFIIIPT